MFIQKGGIKKVTIRVATNGWRHDIFRGKLIVGQESKGCSMRLDLSPIAYQRQLMRKVPSNQINVLRAIALLGREFSGRLSNGVIYVMASGETSVAECAYGAGEQWHTHPQGPEYFSPHDWLLFMTSQDRTHLLVHPSGVLRYQKNSLSVCGEIASTIGISRDTAAILCIARLTRFLERNLRNHNVWELPHTRIAACLKIDVGDVG